MGTGLILQAPAPVAGIPPSQPSRKGEGSSSGLRWNFGRIRYQLGRPLAAWFRGPLSCAAMMPTLRSVFPLLLGVGLLVLGNALIGILLPLRMTAAQVAPALSGLVMSSYYLGLMLGCLLAQGVIRRVGHIRAFAAFAALLTAAFMAHALFAAVLAWTLFRVMTGFCMAGLYATIESWLNVKSSNANRGQVLSLYMITSYFATLLGQLLVNSRELAGVELFCLGGLASALSLVPVVLTRVEGPELGAIQPMRLDELYRLSPLGVTATFGAGLLSGAFSGMGAIYAGGLGLSVLEVSLFMGAAIFGGFVLQWPIGRLSDRFDRRSVMLGMLGGAVLASLVLCLLGYAGSALIPVLLVVTGLGGALAVLYPLAVAQTFDYVDRGRMVAASSGLLLCWALGATLGPLAAALLMQVLGAWALFLHLAVVSIALFAFTLWRMRRRLPRPAPEQTGFVPLPATSTIANALDPRTEPLPEFYAEAPARAER